MPPSWQISLALINAGAQKVLATDNGPGTSMDIETVAVEHCPWRASEARRVMSSILAESPPIDGVIVNNGVLGRGVVLAFAERDGHIPPIAGVDDSNSWLRTAAVKTKKQRLLKWVI